MAIVLALLSTASNVLAADGHMPASAGIGFWIALGIVYLTRKRRIGGWLFYYYFQLYASLIILVLVLGSSFHSYHPSVWEDRTVYTLLIITTLPSFLLKFLEAAVASFLLSKGYRAQRFVNYLKYILITQVVIEALTIYIDYIQFTENLPLTIMGAVFALIWYFYFNRSYRVYCVLSHADWYWDYEEFKKNKSQRKIRGDFQPTIEQPSGQHIAKSIYGGFWNRVVALFIDGLILGLGELMFALPFLAAREQNGATTFGESFWTVFIPAFSIPIGWLYFTLLESSPKQATIGKMAVGLIVTDLNGQPISFGRANGRYWGKVISFLTLGIGHIMTGFTRKKQALHDIMADTLVLARPEGVRSWVTTTIIGGAILILLVGISISVLNLQGVRDARDTQKSITAKPTVTEPAPAKKETPPSPFIQEGPDISLLLPGLPNSNFMKEDVQGKPSPVTTPVPREIKEPSPGPSPAEVALTPSQVFEKVKDSILVVKTLDVQGKVKMQGSGVLLPSGKVATNCHVVEGGASYLVGRGKEIVRATLYAEDGDNDICILDAKGITGNPVQIGKTASLKVGEKVYAVGAPQGLELSLSDGIVAQLRGGPPPLIQTTAAISPGSSGGGLFDAEGRLVGLTTLYMVGGQSLNFAIPVEWIGEVKPGRKLAAEGRIRTEWLKRTIAMESMKDWQGMLDWCRKWTKSEPKDAIAWYGLGVAYRNLNRYNDAIEAFRQALRIDPEYTDAWYNLGFAYGSLNRHNDAIEAYRQALRINPEYAEVWYNLGVVYGLSGNRTAALDAVQKLRRLDPALADKLFNWIGPR